MGFKIDFTIEGGDLIDDWITPVYSQDIKVNGNSITDSIGIEQDGKAIWFTTRQYEEFIREALKSSLFYELRQEMKND